MVFLKVYLTLEKIAPDHPETGKHPRFHGFVVSQVSWCQGSHGFIGFVVSLVLWFYRFHSVIVS